MTCHGEPAVLRDAAQAVCLDGGHHRARAVEEGAVGLAGQAQHGVLGGDPGPRRRVARRVAEDEELLGPVGGGAEQPVDVGVAADHPVQHHHVRGLDGLRVHGDVEDASVHAVLDAGIRGESAGVRVVAVDELEVRRMGCPGSQQLDLQRPDAAADLEHRGALDASRGDDVDNALLGGVSPRRRYRAAVRRANRSPKTASHPRESQQPATRRVWPFERGRCWGPQSSRGPATR